jgi:hypothetical protein
MSHGELGEWGQMEISYHLNQIPHVNRGEGAIGRSVGREDRVKMFFVY